MTAYHTYAILILSGGAHENNESQTRSKKFKTLFTLLWQLLDDLLCSKMILQLLLSCFVFIHPTLTILLLPLISPSHAGVAPRPGTTPPICDSDKLLQVSGRSWYLSASQQLEQVDMKALVIWGPLGSPCVEHPSVNRDTEEDKWGDATD